MNIAEKIRFIHVPTAADPFLIIDKPAGIPSAPLSSEDTYNAVSMAQEQFPELRLVHGRKDIELGLIHRIDTATNGLLLIATTQESYDALIKAQNSGLFVKTYKAKCIQNMTCPQKLGGFPDKSFNETENLLSGKVITVTSFFRSYGKGRAAVRPVIESSNMAAKKKADTRLYTTEIKCTSKMKEYITVACSISVGYRHQVRCHLAWIGLPIIGDPIYNPSKTDTYTAMNFSASKLKFPHPLKGKTLVFEL